MVLELKDYPKPQWGGSVSTLGWPFNCFPDWGQIQGLCLCHTCVFTGGPPQPVGSWGSWARSVCPGKVLTPSLPSQLPTRRAQKACEEARSIISRHPVFSSFHTFFSHLEFLPPPLALSWWPHFLFHWENRENNLIFATFSLSTSWPCIHYPLYPLFSGFIVLCFPSWCPGSARLAAKEQPFDSYTGF